MDRIIQYDHPTSRFFDTYSASRHHGGSLMERNNRWMVIALVIFTAFLLSACAQKSTSTSSESPASVEEIPGSDLKRVVLTEKAAERIGLQTVTVSEETIMKRERVVGEVVTERGEMIANPNQVWVRVPLNERDMKMVARNQPAWVIPLSIDEEEDSDEEEGIFAELDDILGEDDGEALYYLVNSTQTDLLSGERVFVEVSLSESGEVRNVIPYAALIYDVNGGTWVYTKEPNTLAFVRQGIIVDYIIGDVAVLTEGPSAGTEVVIVGGEELFGTETGVSK
jgi:hypothetical protein